MSTPDTELETVALATNQQVLFSVALVALQGCPMSFSQMGLLLARSLTETLDLVSGCVRAVTRASAPSSRDGACLPLLLLCLLHMYSSLYIACMSSSHQYLRAVAVVI